MAKKLTGKSLAKFEAERDVWQEVLDAVREIKAGGGRRKKVVELNRSQFVIGSQKHRDPS